MSKVISHALRHEPWLYELELDKSGWVLLDQLLQALRGYSEYSMLTRADIELMIGSLSKKRHEISGNRIRAIYGHSVAGKFHVDAAVPSENLYHGTLPTLLDSIKEKGLLPMGRQYVHLSRLPGDAELVGKRKSRSPVILIIEAVQASTHGIRFYKVNENIWLSDAIPAIFIHMK